MLRAVAALMVVYTHCTNEMGIFAHGWQQTLPARTAFGTFGVDLFFVISGFVIFISASRLSGRSAALSFLWHRFRRINPVYYLMTLLTLIVWIPSFLRHQRPPLTGLQIASSLALLPFPGSTHTIMSQAWTLRFEWYFYLVLSVLILSRTQRKGQKAGLFLGSMALLGLLLHNDPTELTNFYMNPIILEFVFGAVVGMLYLRWTPERKIALRLLLLGSFSGLVLLITGYYDFLALSGFRTAIPECIHALLWGGSAALIVAGCVFLEKTRTTTSFLQHRFILLLGDASYSIYLFHVLVLNLIDAFYLRVGFFLPPDLAIFIHLIIAIAGSLLFYKWVEIPLLNAFKKTRTSRLIPSRQAGS
jgi:exopolysaccharide production protein ExoZ